MAGAKLIAYINREFAERRAKLPRYGLRDFAASLGIETSTLSQLLRGKRPLSFAAARDILDILNPPLDVRNALLLSLDDEGQFAAPRGDDRDLMADELAKLPAWASHADVAQEVVARTPRQWIEEGLQVLADGAPDLRDFSGISVVADRRKFNEAARRIADFRRSLAVYLDEPGGDGVLVRMNIQLFQVLPEAGRARKDSPFFE